MCKLYERFVPMHIILYNITNYISFRKKEKIHHCHVITECISNHAISGAPTIFSTLLNYSMETLFQLCDDSDSDVRMVAEESLNKIIRVNVERFSLLFLTTML